VIALGFVFCVVWTPSPFIQTRGIY
jgi:hypothetical protein